MNHIEFSQKEVLHNTQKISNGLFIIWFSAWLGSFDRTFLGASMGLKHQIPAELGKPWWWWWWRSCGHVIVDGLPF
jgi:hypothetical protein